MSENAKRLLTMLLAASMLFSMMPLSVSAQDTAAEAPEVNQTVEAPEKLPPVESDQADVQMTGGSMTLELGVRTDVNITEPNTYVEVSFTPEVSGVYLLESFAGADTRAYLYKANGDYLYEDDDGGDGNNFCLVYDLDAGETYIYRVRYYDSETTGSIPVELNKSFLESIVVHPFTAYEHMNGYTCTEWTEDGTEVQYFRYNQLELLQNATYTATLTDGTVIEGKGEYLEYEGKSINFLTDDYQSYNNRWELGKTYTYTVTMLGCTAEATVTIVPHPLVSLTLKPVSVMEHTRGYTQTFWDEETQQDVEIYIYMPGDILWTSEYRAEFNDGTVLTGTDSGFEYQGVWYDFDWDYVDQGLHNIWTAGNTYTVQMYAMGKPVELEISIIKTPLVSLTFEPISVREGTHGYTVYYTDENGQPQEYFYYNPWYVMENATFTATMNDGTVISGDAFNEEYRDHGFVYNGEFVSFTNSTEQDGNNPWFADNTYNIQVFAMGVTGNLPVYIEPSPLESITFTPITVTEGTNGAGNFNWNYDENRHEWHYFYYHTNALLQKSTFVATFRDGTVYSGTPEYVEGHGLGILHNGEYYAFDTISDQSFDRCWLPGNTYQLEVRVEGKKVNVPVTITPSPIVSVVAHPITIVEGQDCIEQTYYPGDSSEGYTYMEYRWYPRAQFTVTLADGLVLDTYGNFEYNGEYFNSSYVDGQYYLYPWQVGGTYTGMAYVGNQYVEIPVTITESPVAGVSFKPILLEQNKGGYWSWSSMVGDFYRYRWTNLVEYTITFRDGTTKSGTYGQGFYHDGIWYGTMDSNDEQSLQPWYPGNEYMAEVNINGKWYEVPVSVAAVERAEGYEYLVQNGTAVITNCYLEEEILRIPAEINGYPVVGITNLGIALACANELHIPDSVKMLSNGLFRENDMVWEQMPLEKLYLGAGISEFSMEILDVGTQILNLKQVEVAADNPYICSVEGVVYDKACTEMLLYPPAKKDLHTVPDTALNIDAVFMLPNWHGITDFQIQFGSSVEGYKVVDGVIYNGDLSTVIMATPEAAGKYVMPESVTWINGGAFANSNLTSVTISPNVTEITYCAFMTCLKLEEINIPESVSYIEDFAFEGCTGLKKVGITNLDAWCRIYNLSNPLRYAHDLYLNGEKIVDLVIPESVAMGVYDGFQINLNAFWGGSFQTVTIPACIESIGENAFADCQQLEKVCISDLQAWSIIWFESPRANPLFCGKNLYLNGVQVVDLVLPDVSWVSEYAFYNSNIKSLTVTERVYGIGMKAFYGSRVETINFNCNNLMSIDAEAFAYSGLKSLTLPDSIWYLEYSAFANCKSLETLELGNGLEEIGFSAFANTAITRVVLPEQVTLVGVGAFRNSKVEELVINCKQVAIADCAFENCPLGDLHFGDNVTYLGEEAFNGSKATVITLPKTVTELSYRTFAYNSNLVSVTIPKELQYIPGTAFEFDINLSHVLYTGTEDEWNSMANYSDELLNATVHFNAVGNEVTTTQDCATVTMTCAICQKTEVFYKGNADHKHDANGVCTVCGHQGEWEYVISNGAATVIGYYGNETKVTVPSKVQGVPVKAISRQLFAYNDTLRAVTLPETVTVIPDGAFTGCYRLQEVKMGSAVTYIGNEAFAGCNWLENIELPDSVTYIGTYAFTEVYMDSFKIPAGVTEIAYGTFTGCWSLSEIEFPANVTTIDCDAFVGCGSLYRLEIPGTIREIRDNAFGSCYLEEILFLGDMPSIHPDAFESNGTPMLYPASNSTWKNLDEKDSNYWVPCYAPEFYVQPYAPAGTVGETVTAMVYADGAFLEYEWYLAEPGSAKFGLYDFGDYLDFTLSEENNGTRAFCLITDVLGQTAKSDVITFKLESEPTGIRISQKPYTLEYDLHQPLRTRGLELMLVFSDNTEEKLVDDYFQVSGYDPETAGKQTVTVHYGSFTATFEVTVNEEKITFSNADEQVEISASNTAIESNTQVVVDKIEDTQAAPELPEIPEFIQENNAVIFDITLEKDGQVVQPKEEVTVSIPVPEHLDSKRCKVFHIDDNGNATDMEAWYQDGRMVFATNHFSYYAVVETEGVTVSGTVTGSELAGTVVKLICGNEVLATVSVNRNGTYRFENVAGNSYILEAFQEGLAPKQIEIQVADEDLLLDILLAILGDLDGNTNVNTDDVVALLLHVSMPDVFPVEAECDFTKDGQVNTDDVVALLLHVSMPDVFPL